MSFLFYPAANNINIIHINTIAANAKKLIMS
jgi:hypothetical protein